MKNLLLLCFALFASSEVVKGQLTIGETQVDTQTVITGLDTPWEIIWGPDNHLWITERYGRISRIDPITGTQEVILDLSSTVTQQGESGMLGLALHPDFPSDSRVFVVYTYLNGSDIEERLVAYEYENGSLSNPTTLIDAIPGNTTHDGSRLLFDSENHLFMTTGDAQNQPAAQDWNSLNGKVLRINPDGSIPADNPYPNNPAYSIGHRNAQGLCIGPNSQIFSSEHGPNTDDELNIIEKGRNYGWPEVHGFCDLSSEETFCIDSNVREPQYAWSPTIAVSDIEYYNSDAIPELKGSILLMTLKEKDMRVMHIDQDGQTVHDTEILFDDMWNRLRAICVAPDGSIYISNSHSNWGGSTSFDHQIIRIYNPEYQGHTDPSDEKKVVPYPNPFIDKLNIKTGIPKSDLLYALTSTQGKLICEGDQDLVLDYLSSATAQAGIYIMTTMSADQTFHNRIIKSKN